MWGVKAHPLRALAEARWDVLGQVEYGDYDPKTDKRDMVSEVRQELADAWNYLGCLHQQGKLSDIGLHACRLAIRDAWDRLGRFLADE